MLIFSSRINKWLSEPSTLNSAYQNLTDQLKESLEYNASHILVNEEDQANNILKELNEGKDFDDLAKNVLRFANANRFFKS